MQYLLCFEMYDENYHYFYRLLGPYEPRPVENRERVGNEDVPMIQPHHYLKLMGEDVPMIQPTSLSQIELMGKDGQISKVEIVHDPFQKENKYILVLHAGNLLKRLPSMSKSLVPRKDK
jgi:hypothetical protein